MKVLKSKSYYSYQDVPCNNKNMWRRMIYTFVAFSPCLGNIMFQNYFGVSCLSQMLCFRLSTMLMFQIGQEDQVYIMQLTMDMQRCHGVLCFHSFLRKIVNPRSTNVPHHIETNQMIYIANQLPGFYMIRNIGR